MQINLMMKMVVGTIDQANFNQYGIGEKKHFVAVDLYVRGNKTTPAPEYEANGTECYGG